MTHAYLKVNQARIFLELQLVPEETAAVGS